MSTNFFLPHMRKAMEEMSRRLQAIDVVLEVRDARIPFTSASPLLDTMIGRTRQRIVVFNKSDLGDPSCCKVVTADIERQGYCAIWASGTQQHTVRAVLQASTDLLRSKRPNADLSLMMVVGIPNVGKSTLTNALRDEARRSGMLEVELTQKTQARARTGRLAGVTRHINGFKVWAARFERPKVLDLVNFGVCQVCDAPLSYVLDTAGLLVPGSQEGQTATKLALTGAINSSVIDEVAQAELLLRLLATPYQRQRLVEHAKQTSNRGGCSVERTVHGSRAHGRNGKHRRLASLVAEALDGELSLCSEIEVPAKWWPDSTGAQACVLQSRRRVLHAVLHRIGLSKAGNTMSQELDMCRRLVTAYRVGGLGRYTLDEVPTTGNTVTLMQAGADTLPPYAAEML